MSAGWRHADFAALVGEPVTLCVADGPARDVPARVTACSEPETHGDIVSYSVTVVAGPDAPRQQAVFFLAAVGHEPEPVFLVPRRDVGDGLEYEAVFNQSVDDGSNP